MKDYSGNKNRNFKPYIILAFAILLLAGAYVFSRSKNNPILSNKVASIPDQNRLVQAINGIMVPASAAQRPFAVVVENHPDSRPQSGLSQADIVYEALAEGGIT